jgi:hypothetical protein
MSIEIIYISLLVVLAISLVFMVVKYFGLRRGLIYLREDIKHMALKDGVNDRLYDEFILRTRNILNLKKHKSS